MSDKITFEKRKKFVYCKYAGQFSLEPMLNLAKEANTFCTLNGYNAIVVDITESHGDEKVFNRFRHARAVSEFVDKKIKIAIVAKPEQDKNRFWETVARNRLIKTKFFPDLKSAEKWLCADSPS